MGDVKVTEADRECCENVFGEIVMGNTKRAEAVAARHRIQSTKALQEQLAERDAEVAALRTALGSLRDYVSDVSEGHLAYAEARPSIRKMAAEDLAAIDALTKDQTDAE